MFNKTDSKGVSLSNKITERYMLGSLEQDNTEGGKEHTLTIKGTTYIVSDKFRSMLQNLLIDWGTFLEIYNKNLDLCKLCDQVIRMLDIKDNEYLRDTMLPVVKEIYNMPAEAHLTCMLKQFMLYEPVSIAIHSLFTTIKHHFEDIVKKFIEVRNEYIETNNLKGQINNWEEILPQWEEINMLNELDSSSVILLFLSPTKEIKELCNEEAMLHFTTGNKPIDAKIHAIKSKLKKFKYAGYCPKVPHERLKKLLLFPLEEFQTAIESMAKDNVVFPDYSNLEDQLNVVLNDQKNKPKITTKFTLKDLPEEFKEEETLDQQTKLKIIRWYVNEILQMRKLLIIDGRRYEEYYESKAKKILEVNDILSKQLILN